MDIKSLELTESEFDLIIEGLDALPEKGAAGEILGSLFECMFLKDNPEAFEKRQLERERKREELDRKKEQQKEDVKVLQGKLLMLKRILLQDGALKQAHDIIATK